MNQKLDFLSKKVLIFAAVISFSLIAAVLIYSFFASLKPPVIPPMPTPPGLTNQEVMDKTASLIKAGDLSACDSVDKMVNGVNYRTVCRDNILEDQAKKNFDFSACDKIGGSAAALKDCRQKVFMLFLRKEKSLAVCDKVPEDFKQGCPNAYWLVAAEESADPRLCDKITSEVGKYNCQEDILFSMLKQNKNVDCKMFSLKSVKDICLLPDKQRKDFLNAR